MKRKISISLLTPVHLSDVIVVTKKRKYIGYYDEILKGWYRQINRYGYEPIKINNVISWQPISKDNTIKS